MPSTDQQTEVVVVGARCAGAPLATLLARAGVDVVLLEQARFPRDTMSTHVMEANVLAFLDRLGVIEQVRATGAPFVMRSHVRVDDLTTTQAIPQVAGDVGGAVPVRRFVLDPILVGAATAAGADVRMVAKGTYDRMLDMFNHRSDPWEVFTPTVATAATLRLLVRHGAPRRRLLREFRELAVAVRRRERGGRRRHRGGGGPLRLAASDTP